MKTTMSSLFFLLLLASPMGEARAQDYVCSSGVVPLPEAVKMESPLLHYVGKAADGRPVYYQPNSEAVYVYDADFKQNPAMMRWTAVNDRRSQTPCPASPGAGPGNCPFTVVKSWGVKSFLASLHVACGTQASLDPSSLNKNQLNGITGACVEYDKNLSSDRGRCCEQLEFNPNNLKCDEPAMVDPSLETCGGHGDCQNQMGCYAQRSTDLFTLESTEPLASIVSGQVEDWMDENKMKADGVACEHAKECNSYSCVNRTCEARKVCRYGDVNESAPVNVRCMEGLEKDAVSKCQPGPGHSPYIGMLDAIQFDSNGQCGFTINQEDKRVAELAMKSTRAMEWVLYRLSTEDPGDCFKLSSHLRKKVGEEMFKTRQSILTNYNSQIAQIEADYKTILGAKSGETRTVQMHGQSLPEGDLASRQTGGFDSLMLMYRRNALFQAYEQAMLDLTNKTSDVMFQLSESMRNWQDDDEQWNLGSGVVVQKFDCEAKYEKWKFWGMKWVARRHDETKQRWSTYYDVDMKKQLNKDILAREGVQNHLALIHQQDVPQVMEMYGLSHALIDPLNWMNKGALKFDNFGDNKNLNSEPGTWETVGRIGAGVITTGITELLGVFNSSRQTRHARKLNGAKNGTYTHLYRAFKEDINEYYKSLKENPSQKDFIYEPELTGLEGKDCATNPDQTGCQLYKKHVDDMTDQAFAQFLSYSHHTKDNYAHYFNNSKTGRLLLLSKYVVDLHNLSVYYNAVVEKRNVQNTCIEKLIKNINDNFDTNNGGVGTGGTYYAEGTQAAKSKAKNGQSKSSLPTLAFSKFHVDLVTGKPARSTSANLDGSAGGGSKGSGANVDKGTSGVAAAITKRKGEIFDSNKKAALKGINLSAREASMDKILGTAANKSTLGATGAMGIGGAISGASGAGASVGSSSHKSSLDAEEAKGANASGVGNADVNGGDFKGQGGIGGGPGMGGRGGFAGMDSMNGSLPGGDATLGAHDVDGVGGKDSSGMSDEEKEVMMANFERNKGKYNPNEDDTLFNVLSKAYTRNLDKVLIKKKKIQD